MIYLIDFKLTMNDLYDILNNFKGAITGYHAIKISYYILERTLKVTRITLNHI